MRRRGAGVVAAVAALVGSVLLALPAAAVTSDLEVVAGGLDNPRGLAFDPVTGDLVVALAGRGGDSDTCRMGAEGGTECYGATGKVVRIADATGPAGDATVTDELAGLPSLAPKEGEMAGAAATGPHGVAFVGDSLFVTIGLGADPAERDTLAATAPGANDLGTLREITGGVDQGTVADLAGFEAAEDPDEAGADSNPYGVTAGSGAAEVLVVDSGGNTLLLVDTDGTLGDNVTVEAVFGPEVIPFPGGLPFGPPAGTPFPSQAVPTSVDGPGPLTDVDNVVGQLTGFPFVPGSSEVLGVEDVGMAGVPLAERGQRPVATGFTNVIDTAWGPDGNLYVLEIATNGLMSGDFTGALFRVDPDAPGTRELVRNDLTAPGGIVFGPDGLAYVSNFSIFPGGAPAPAPSGQVVRFDAVDDDALLTTSDDTATTQEDQVVEIDVGANDGPNIDVNAVTITGGGAAWVVDAMTIAFQPAAGQSGSTTLVYRTCSEGGTCLNATVAVTIDDDDPVDRISGPTRIGTAVAASRAGFPGGAATVLLARSDVYADALTGSVLGGQLGAPLLLTPTDALPDEVVEEIARLGATQVIILGGPAAVSEDVEDDLETEARIDPAAIQRIRGADRFATAVAIREAVLAGQETPTTAVYVAEGIDPDPRRGFADPLAVSALAAFQGVPILLVATDTLPSATREALGDGVDVAHVVGGPAAVDGSVFDAIESEVGAGNVDRISGPDRYATAAAVVERAIAAGMDPKHLFLATGENWPDALVAGGLVARVGGVLLLVHPTDLSRSPQVGDHVRDNNEMTDVDVLGGPGAVSDAVLQGVSDAVVAS